MTFEMPLPPSLANARLHWRAKHRAKAAYWKILDTRQSFGIIENPPLDPMSRARITATMFVWAKRDQDNAMASLKWSIDWLVTRGYLADDKEENLEWTGLPKQVIDRANQRLLLTLEAA